MAHPCIMYHPCNTAEGSRHQHVSTPAENYPFHKNVIDEYEKGIKVEMEHTGDKDLAAEIARDHLYEDPKYYTALAKVEKD